MAATTLVQYVAIRRDLLKVLKWPVGAVITQACHACSAVVHIFHDDENTQAYLADIDRMHKIIVEVTTSCNSAYKHFIFYVLILRKNLVFQWRTSFCLIANQFFDLHRVPAVATCHNNNNINNNNIIYILYYNILYNIIYYNIIYIFVPSYNNHWQWAIKSKKKTCTNHNVQLIGSVALYR